MKQLSVCLAAAGAVALAPAAHADAPHYTHTWVSAYVMRVVDAAPPLLETLDMYKSDGLVLVDWGPAEGEPPEIDYAYYGFKASRLSADERKDRKRVREQHDWLIRYGACHDAQSRMGGRVFAAALQWDDDDAKKTAAEFGGLVAEFSQVMRQQGVSQNAARTATKLRFESDTATAYITLSRDHPRIEAAYVRKAGPESGGKPCAPGPASKPD